MTEESVLRELCHFGILTQSDVCNMANSAYFVESTPPRASSVSFSYFVSMLHTHYHNSNLIWRTVSRRVDEVIPSDRLRRVASRDASRAIQWYGLIQLT